MKKQTFNWPRVIAQLGVIAFVLLLSFFPKLIGISTPDFEAYCPFGGMQALGSYLLNQALSCTMTSTQIVMGVLLFVAVLVFSKLFCSYICPIGIISEWLGKIGEKLKIRFSITGIADKVLRALKYILLFITLYFTLQSNELFCKKFDPYYALTSGFDTDVVIWYAVISITLVILGSIFIRLFWCKYLCPLGAISNIFKFSLFFVALIGIYLILLKAEIEISYVYPLAVACIGGFIIEVTGQQSRIFPLAKVTRNSQSCINCNLCSEKCHQGIDVASLQTVKHVDCNLCGDCLLVCPVQNTLTLNKSSRLKRLPVIATVVLVISGIALGSFWEIPTIDEKWAEPEVISEAAIFSQAGLKNIKCFGSSKAFANKMRKINGVYGVATYVKNNRVKIYYDDNILNENKIQKLLFSPQKQKLKTLHKKIETVYGVTLQLENFFDLYDFNYLSLLLQQKTNAVGLISEYACPVIVKIYFPAEIENKKELKSTIEAEILELETTSGIKEIELKYEVVGTPEYFIINRGEYLTSLFTPYQNSFNFIENYSEKVIADYVLSLDKNKKQKNKLSYLVSHISNDTGVVQFRTILDKNFEEIVVISYIDTITNITNINEALLADTLIINYSSGQTGKVSNMFNFSEEIKTVNSKNNTELKD